MKAIGFNAGQYGDLAMNVVAAGVLAEIHPECKLTFAIGNRYADCEGAFRFQKNIDSTYIWDSYNTWPAPTDLKYMEEKKFDLAFNAMPIHPDPQWYLKRHQTEEVCYMHGLPPPRSRKINLQKYWPSEGRENIYKNYVYITREGSFENKKVSVSQFTEVEKFLTSKGLSIITPYADKIEKHLSYFDSIRIMTACKFLITVDTGMCWFASAYNIPTVGLYGYEFYPGATTSKNWQPENPNAIYLEDKRVRDIDPERIIEAIKLLL